MSKNKQYAGIDMSKDVFDVSYPDGSHKTFENDKQGFRSFIQSLSGEVHCVMENTGRYHQPLACYLYDHCLDVSVMNALVIKRFIQMRLKVTKTDKADAKMIREYAEWDSPELWEPPSEYITQCKNLRGLVALLVKQRTALKNQLHSLKNSGSSHKLPQQVINRQIKSLDQEIDGLESEMLLLVKACDGDLLSRLGSIPGMGRKTAMAMIVATDGFRNFTNSKQLISYFGLSPMIWLSGTSIRGRSRISKSGDKDVRNLLFMCSFTAYKHNRACAELYDRIVNKGKSKKLALIAVSNKLLKQAFAISQNGLTYDENYRSKNPGIN